MNEPYLISSHPDAKDFVAALERCAKDGRSVELERLSGIQTHTFAGRIVSVTPAEDRLLVQRVDEEPQSYWIRYIYRVVDADGVTTENRPALATQDEALERRRQRAEHGQRVLVEQGFVPAVGLVTSSLAGKVGGMMNGRKCKFFAFKSRGSKAVLAVVYAKDEVAAARCMRLLDAETSTWDIFASYLQAHFLWPAWLNLREQAQVYATELRAGLPALPPEADGWQQAEREALYKERGLTWADWGHTASLYSLEGAELDFEALFALADIVPATLLNLYLIVAFDSTQFFDEIDRVNSSTLEQFMRYGLAIARSAPTVDDALETMAIARLRELVEIAGTGFKAKGAAVLRAHLKTCMTPRLEMETVQRSRYKKYQLLPPPGWTWDQFQFFPADYRAMLNALNQWMFNRWAQPRAAERFTALA